MLTCTCSAKFIYGARIGVGVFESPAGRYRGRAGTCRRYAYVCAGQRSRLRRVPLFHVQDTPNRFGQLSIVIDAHTFMTWLSHAHITARHGIVRVRGAACAAFIAEDERARRGGENRRSLILRWSRGRIGVTNVVPVVTATVR